MLTYDDIVTSLEDAWTAAGLHEHTLTESVIPTSHDRSYRVELFPEHGEPLTPENMPPWVEVTFTWSALHQIRSEHRNIDPGPVDLIWTYMVNAFGMQDRGDQELVRMFQKTFQRVFHQFYPDEVVELELLPVEVRRMYMNDGQRMHAAYVQLVSINITDLSEQWNERKPTRLIELLHIEVEFASAFLHALHDTFNPGGRGGYRSVDTA